MVYIEEQVVKYGLKQLWPLRQPGLLKNSAIFEIIERLKSVTFLIKSGALLKRCNSLSYENKFQFLRIFFYDDEMILVFK